MFDNDTVYLGAAMWQLTEQLSENSKDAPPCEAVAVYVAKQIEGPCLGKEAIVKVRMEIPNILYPEFLPEDLEELKDVNGFSVYTVEELNNLNRLTQAGCKSSLRLIGWYSEKQTEHMPLPGGYLVWILMEKVPGITPWDFWEMPREERDQIRKSFHEALMEVYSHGIAPQDEGRRNLVWDKDNRKCYIVDYEDCEHIDEKRMEDVHWMSRANFRWELEAWNGFDKPLQL
ncbi:hypothetical protein B7463_g6263, partial [Scytalidium lignicola]